MIPDSNSNSLTSETNVATGCEPMAMDDAMEPFIPKSLNFVDTFSFSISTMTSSYLHRIPSGSRQWEIYLEDLVDSKAKRSRRTKCERESVTDFLQRFPILESS